MTDTLFSDITWHSPGTIQIPSFIHSWLLDPDSLTAKLRQQTDAFNVQVLHHGPGALNPDETLMLGDYAEDIQVREVLLCASETPWVFARSLIPNGTSANTILNSLQHIGNKPLGEALFDTPSVERGPFQVARFSTQGAIAALDKECEQYRTETDYLWGRRRIFSVEAVPVVVAEVFLHQAPCYKELC